MKGGGEVDNAEEHVASKGSNKVGNLAGQPGKAKNGTGKEAGGKQEVNHYIHI